MKGRENENEISVVLGSTGALGAAVVNELDKQGKQVIAVTRSLEKAERVFGNLNIVIKEANILNEDEAIKATEGAQIIYHCVGVPYTRWLKDFPKIMKNVLASAEKNNAKLVYADNLYMYGRMQSESISEEHVLGTTSKKGKLRIELANQILESHSSGKIESVVVRFGDFYGPNVVNGFSKPLFANPLNNKPASWLFDLDQKHSLIFIKDAVKGIIKLAENTDAYGQVWHIEGSEALTGREFISKIYDELDQELKINCLSEKTMRILGLFVPIVKELKELKEQWNYPFVIDGSRFKNKFSDFSYTSHENAISETIQWFRNGN